MGKLDAAKIELMFVSEIDGIVPGSLQLVLSLLEGLHNKTQLNAVLIHKARVAEIHFKNTTAKVSQLNLLTFSAYSELHLQNHLVRL